MATLDAIDRVLLEALQRNGRETHVGLARQDGVTPPAVLERVREQARDSLDKLLQAN